MGCGDVIADHRHVTLVTNASMTSQSDEYSMADSPVGVARHVMCVTSPLPRRGLGRIYTWFKGLIPSS